MLLLLLLQSNFVLRRIFPIAYRDLITQYAAEYGLDPLLVAAVVQVESKYRPDAVSAKGAIGLMQIMPETGEWIAGQLKLDGFTPSDLSDPATNIRLGTWYLADLNREFDGDPAVVLAAYNGGRGRVREWLASEQWGGGYHEIDNIPFAETREFVRRVYRMYGIYGRLYG